MNWTTVADIRRQVMSAWDRGSLLREMVVKESRFPMRLTLKRPSAGEMSGEFASVREWIAELRKLEAKGFRIVWRETNHRIIGQNSLPDELWLGSPQDAVAFIGKQRDAARFQDLVKTTRDPYPALLAWLAEYPLKALGLADQWERLLAIVGWIQTHPRPNVYLRQVDAPGVHTKFIEQHRGVLSELLDIVLPQDAIAGDAAGVRGFCKCYGFKEKPSRIRFRILDPTLFLLSPGEEQDITITDRAFARLRIPVQRVFITENETNFLAFPSVSRSIVLFGAGYGFEMLAGARWLDQCSLHYWGDLDTHGFAILDQLRALFPHAESLLMDQQTLLEHRCHWVQETNPEKRDLCRLDVSEALVYDDLRFDRLGKHVRLEQERIAYSVLENTLRTIEDV